MSRGGPLVVHLRAIAFSAALFALTLSVLQPIVHAVAMRDGAPRSLWSVICTAASVESETGERRGTSDIAVDPDCCLGLAHSQIVAAPPATFTLLAPVTTPVQRPRRLDHADNLGIRDGPNQPRAPPVSFA